MGRKLTFGGLRNHELRLLPVTFSFTAFERYILTKQSEKDYADGKIKKANMSNALRLIIEEKSIELGLKFEDRHKNAEYLAFLEENGFSTGQ